MRTGQAISRSKALRALLCLALVASFQAWIAPGAIGRAELHGTSGILPPVSSTALIHGSRDGHRLDAAKERSPGDIAFVLDAAAAAARDRGRPIAIRPEYLHPQLVVVRHQSGRSPPQEIS